MLVALVRRRLSQSAPTPSPAKPPITSRPSQSSSKVSWDLHVAICPHGDRMHPAGLSKQMAHTSFVRVGRATVAVVAARSLCGESLSTTCAAQSTSLTSSAGSAFWESAGWDSNRKSGNPSALSVEGKPAQQQLIEAHAQMPRDLRQRWLRSASARVTHAATGTGKTRDLTSGIMT